jgi:small-conductance mechanosensitive channel
MTSTTATTTTVLALPVPKDILSERTVSPGGFGPLALILFFALAMLASRGLRKARAGLPHHGLVPRILGITLMCVRALAILVLVQLIVQLLPATISPIVPWVLAAAAAAVGWSARDLLPDVIAGIVLEVERRVRAGDWVKAGPIEGVVESIGFRASALLDAHGKRWTVPNRHLVQRTVASDASPWPEVTVEVTVPPAKQTPDIERRVREAALALPWVAPAEVLVVRGEAGVYVLRARVLEGKFAAPFENAVRRLFFFHS